MLISCWSVKGGSGTTVVAAALALVLSRVAGERTLLADLGGDALAVLGLPEPAGPGLAGWLAAPGDVPADALARLAVDAGDGLRVLAWGPPAPPPVPGRGELLAAALAAEPGVVVADCGANPEGPARWLAAAATVSLLVTRPCFLALRRASASPLRPSGIVLVEEPGRSIRGDDVEGVLGAPVRARVRVHPAIARAVDSGLLKDLPRQLQSALRSAA